MQRRENKAGEIAQQRMKKKREHGPTRTQARAGEQTGTRQKGRKQNPCLKTMRTSGGQKDKNKGRDDISLFQRLWSPKEKDRTAKIQKDRKTKDQKKGRTEGQKGRIRYSSCRDPGDTGRKTKRQKGGRT